MITTADTTLLETHFVFLKKNNNLHFSYLTS